MPEFHESPEAMPRTLRDLRSALSSLKEEIEAIEWYTERVALCADPVLAGVLAHNRDEEIEHACMLLEWLRNTTPPWNQMLRKYLFQEALAPGVAVAADSPAAPHRSGARSGALGIGSLKA